MSCKSLVSMKENPDRKKSVTPFLHGVHSRPLKVREYTLGVFGTTLSEGAFEKFHNQLV